MSIRVGATVLTMFLVGCASIPAIEIEIPNLATWFAPENAVKVEELRRSQQCASPDGETRVHLFKNLAAVRDWEAQRGLSLLGEEPLPKVSYAVVELGARDRSGAGVAVSRNAGRKQDLLLLRATFFEPPADAPAATIAPCALVRLPRADYSGVAVYDQAGQLRARVRAP